MTSLPLCRASSKMSIMPSVATRRSDTKVLLNLKRNTPGRSLFERPQTCPPQGVHFRSASKIDPPRLACCAARFDSKRVVRGNVDSGDDWPDSARALHQRQDDQGDFPGSEGIPEHGPQGTSVGGDIVRVRA